MPVARSAFMYAAAALLCACAWGEETIKIISSFPHTGSSANQSNTTTNGIRMAIEEAGGHAGGFQIVYEQLDDASPERGAWDPALEAANADKAIADPDVMAYIGTLNSGAAKISMPKLNAAGLVMVSPGNTWPGLTKAGLGEMNEPVAYRPSGKITYFRVMPTDDLQGPAAAEWSKALGATKVYVLHDNQLYGRGIAKLYEKAARGLGMKVAGMEGIEPRASDFRSLVTKIRAAGVDLVFFGGSVQTKAGQIAKDLRNAGLKDVKYMVPDGCFEQAFIDGAGAANVNGNTYVTFGGVPPDRLTGRGKAFYENYHKQFGGEPESYAVYGYDAARAILAAIDRAGKKDRAAIVREVAATKDFDGALGRWSFDENGDTTLRTMSGNTIQDGRFVFVTLLGQQN